MKNKLAYLFLFIISFQTGVITYLCLNPRVRVEYKMMFLIVDPSNDESPTLSESI